MEVQKSYNLKYFGTKKVESRRWVSDTKWGTELNLGNCEN